MDRLFPEPKAYRTNAIRQTVRGVQWLQAVFVLIIGFVSFGVSITTCLLFIVIVVVSEITIRFTKEKQS